MERVLSNFITNLDPNKVYFLESEVETWLHPTEASLQTILDQFCHADYSAFIQIQAIYERAIVRRNEIEQEMEKWLLPTGVKNEEFKDLAFAKSREELTNRCFRMKAMLYELAERLGGENRDVFMQRVQKRRTNREAEWLTNSEDKQKLLLTNVLKASAESLDSHTVYFTPSEANQFTIQVQQRLFGIGVRLKDNLDGFTVMQVLENSPASQGGKLKINDKIIAVNQEPIIGLDITEAVDLIRGEKGTPVTLTILRETVKDTHANEKLDVELTRNEVVIEESRLDSTLEPFGEGVIAHLRLLTFYQDQNSKSSSDMRKALENIKKEHKLEGVILDLRNNAGGLLSQAVEVAGLFINPGVVVSIKDNSGRIQNLRALEGKPIFDGPLIILVNRSQRISSGNRGSSATRLRSSDHRG